MRTGVFEGGHFVGLAYQCLSTGALSTTDNAGQWYCEEATGDAQNQIQFLLEDFALGSPVSTSDSNIRLTELFQNADAQAQRLYTVNTARVLLSASDALTSESSDGNASQRYTVKPGAFVSADFTLSKDISSEFILFDAGTNIPIISEHEAEVVLSQWQAVTTETDISALGFRMLHTAARFEEVQEFDRNGNPAGSIYTYRDFAKIKYLLPGIQDKAPIVFLSDSSLSADIYLTPLDERKGWAQLTALQGFPSYIYYPENSHTAGLPRAFNRLTRKSITADLWQEFGLGREEGMFYTGSLFAASNVEQLYAMLSVTALVDNAPSPTDNLAAWMADVTAEHNQAPIVVAHGNAGATVNALLADGDITIKGLVLIEPAECLAAQVARGAYGDAPVITVFGSRVEERKAEAFTRCGDMVAGLGDDSAMQIALADTGNTGLPMVDSNHAAVLAQIITALSTRTDIAMQTQASGSPPLIASFDAFYLGGQVQQQTPDTQAISGASYVQSLVPLRAVPNRASLAPIILYPGLNFSASTFLSTADGRLGWAHQFALAGHPVFLFDPTNTSPSAIDVSEESLSAWRLGDAWNRFSDSVSFDEASQQGVPDAATQFPYDSINGFYTQMISAGGRGGSNSDNFQALLEKVHASYGKAIIMGHSKGSEVAFSVAGSQADKVAGLVALEPTQCDTFGGASPAAGVTTAAEIGPFLAVYGDYIQSRRQTGRFVSCTETVQSVADAGNASLFISLPGDDFTQSGAVLSAGDALFQTGYGPAPSSAPIYGNTHMYMSDNNSAEIAREIIDFFRAELPN